MVIISPGIDRIENKVLASSEGPATLAYNLSPKTTSSDNTPFLTNPHLRSTAPSEGLAIDTPSSSTGLNSNSSSWAEVLVPHSSSAAQINAFPWSHLLVFGGGW